jgi:hypothetical protein
MITSADQEHLSIEYIKIPYLLINSRGLRIKCPRTASKRNSKYRVYIIG